MNAAGLENTLAKLHAKQIKELFVLWDKIRKAQHPLTEKVMALTDDLGDGEYALLEEEERIDDVAFDLGELIARLLDPEKIRQIKAATTDKTLRSHLLAYLIWRDGPRKYEWDEIVLYVDFVWQPELQAMIEDPASAAFGALEVMVWIDENFPYTEEDITSPSAQPASSAPPRPVAETHGA